MIIFVIVKYTCTYIHNLANAVQLYIWKSSWENAIE
jgi:hypothetical protein